MENLKSMGSLSGSERVTNVSVTVVLYRSDSKLASIEID